MVHVPEFPALSRADFMIRQGLKDIESLQISCGAANIQGYSCHIGDMRYIGGKSQIDNVKASNRSC